MGMETGMGVRLGNGNGDDSVSINSIIESRDAIFDENRFSSMPRPEDIISNSDESQRDDHSNDVPSETPEPRRGKRARKAKSYRYDFQLYLVEGSRDQIGSQYSYCYSIEEDPRTYRSYAMSRCFFLERTIDDEIGSIMENNTWVLSDLHQARLVIQGFRQKEGIDYLETYAPVARITTIRLLLALAAIHNLVIHQLDVKTAFLNGNEHKVRKLVKSLYGLKQVPKQWHQKFDEVVLSSGFLLNQSDKCVYRKFDDIVGRLKRFTNNPSRQHWHAITRVFKYLKGAILWASKKQTCITGSTTESKFVALAAVGKETEWLRNLIHEISIWPKPIAPISIHCDSAATLAKAYSQIYNCKSRHLGVRHSMIRELIMNGVISIEFVRSQHNLADHLTKDLARDLVIKSVIGMGLKSI
ncbi:zinc finger, CCHC-type containing protein [Tanacetum coccineum]